ncbi:MAG: NADH-quinone oxidoreductase subunit M [Candidatus Cloacimonetes bacterium 4572_55]|nr:MAG: NADH-quinone oxidoreductase subunit M [Candidatus Cloacimonetes bacterium 4572_55]
MGLLSLIVFLPLLGAILLLFFPKDAHKAIRIFAIIIFSAIFLLSLPLYFQFDSSQSGLQFEEQINWIGSIGASYHIGVDGISVLLVLLTAFLGPIVCLSTWKNITIRIRGFYISLLLLQTGMLGAFVSFDLLLFYIFWEVMLIPMFFLIGIWGSENRIYATVKFFLYTMVGSLLMFLAGLYLYNVAGTFELSILYETIRANSIPESVQLWLFAAFALSFAIKVPLFPFHTWLPDAHVQAPTAGSVILAGVLLKMGTYGFIRFAIPLFPDATLVFAPYLSTLAAVGIIYGALMALAQTDMKKLIAYSSVSHLGYVVLGLFAFNSAGQLSLQGVEGGIYQMLSHGLSTGSLFLLVGVIYERRHTKTIAEFGGLAKVMPIYAVIFMITMLSSIGLPGLNGFIGEFLILMGAFSANYVFGIMGALGVILGAVYMLILYQRTFFGEITNKKNLPLNDLTAREIVVFAPLIIMMVIMGIFPNLFLEKMHATLQALPNIEMFTR